MATVATAPWARIVPDMPNRMTARDLLALPDEPGYELVDGRLVRNMPMGGLHGVVGSPLHGYLWSYVTPRRLGRIVTAETGFDLGPTGQPNTVLAPDLAFVRADRVPSEASEIYTEFWPLAPDLVAEIVSPSQYRPEMEAKARRWLAAGVRLLWVIWPLTREVDAWRPGSGAPAATLGPDDQLDGLDVVPGFTLAVADLFRQ